MPDPGFEVRVDPAVHATHPDYVAPVLLASGLGNGPSDAGSDAQLAAAEEDLRASGLAKATEHPHIAAWRAAFSGFGAKPSRYPSSAEALMTRVLKGSHCAGDPAALATSRARASSAPAVGAFTPQDNNAGDRLRRPPPPEIGGALRLT